MIEEIKPDNLLEDEEIFDQEQRIRDISKMPVVGKVAQPTPTPEKQNIRALESSKETSEPETPAQNVRSKPVQGVGSLPTANIVVSGWLEDWRKALSEDLDLIRTAPEADQINFNKISGLYKYGGLNLEEADKVLRRLIANNRSVGPTSRGFFAGMSDEQAIDWAMKVGMQDMPTETVRGPNNKPIILEGKPLEIPRMLTSQFYAITYLANLLHKKAQGDGKSELERYRSMPSVQTRIAEQQAEHNETYGPGETIFGIGRSAVENAWNYLGLPDTGALNWVFGSYGKPFSARDNGIYAAPGGELWHPDVSQTVEKRTITLPNGKVIDANVTYRLNPSDAASETVMTVPSWEKTNVIRMYNVALPVTLGEIGSEEDADARIREIYFDRLAEIGKWSSEAKQFFRQLLTSEGLKGPAIISVSTGNPVTWSDVVGNRGMQVYQDSSDLVGSGQKIFELAKARRAQFGGTLLDNFYTIQDTMYELEEEASKAASNTVTANLAKLSEDEESLSSKLASGLVQEGTGWLLLAAKPTEFILGDTITDLISSTAGYFKQQANNSNTVQELREVAPELADNLINYFDDKVRMKTATRLEAVGGVSGRYTAEQRANAIRFASAWTEIRVLENFIEDSKDQGQIDEAKKRIVELSRGVRQYEDDYKTFVAAENTQKISGTTSAAAPYVQAIPQVVSMLVARRVFSSGGSAANSVITKSPTLSGLRAAGQSNYLKFTASNPTINRVTLFGRNHIKPGLHGALYSAPSVLGRVDVSSNRRQALDSGLFELVGGVLVGTQARRVTNAGTRRFTNYQVNVRGKNAGYGTGRMGRLAETAMDTSIEVLAELSPSIVGQYITEGTIPSWGQLVESLPVIVLGEKGGDVLGFTSDRVKSLFGFDAPSDFRVRVANNLYTDGEGRFSMTIATPNGLMQHTLSSLQTEQLLKDGKLEFPTGGKEPHVFTLEGAVVKSPEEFDQIKTKVNGTMLSDLTHLVFGVYGDGRDRLVDIESDEIVIDTDGEIQSLKDLISRELTSGAVRVESDASGKRSDNRSFSLLRILHSNQFGPRLSAAVLGGDSETANTILYMRAKGLINYNEVTGDITITEEGSREFEKIHDFMVNFKKEADTITKGELEPPEVLGTELENLVNQGTEHAEAVTKILPQDMGVKQAPPSISPYELSQMSQAEMDVVMFGLRSGKLQFDPVSGYVTSANFVGGSGNKFVNFGSGSIGFFNFLAYEAGRQVQQEKLISPERQVGVEFEVEIRGFKQSSGFGLPAGILDAISQIHGNKAKSVKYSENQDGTIKMTILDAEGNELETIYNLKVTRPNYGPAAVGAAIDALRARDISKGKTPRDEYSDDEINNFLKDASDGFAYHSVANSSSNPAGGSEVETYLMPGRVTEKSESLTRQIADRIKNRVFGNNTENFLSLAELSRPKVVTTAEGQTTLTSEQRNLLDGNLRQLGFTDTQIDSLGDSQKLDYSQDKVTPSSKEEYDRQKSKAENDRKADEFLSKIKPKLSGKGQELADVVFAPDQQPIRINGDDYGDMTKDEKTVIQEGLKSGRLIFDEDRKEIRNAAKVKTSSRGVNLNFGSSNRNTFLIHEIGKAMDMGDSQTAESLLGRLAAENGISRDADSMNSFREKVLQDYDRLTQLSEYRQSEALDMLESRGVVDAKITTDVSDFVPESTKKSMKVSTDLTGLSAVNIEDSVAEPDLPEAPQTILRPKGKKDIANISDSELDWRNTNNPGPLDSVVFIRDKNRPARGRQTYVKNADGTYSNINDSSDILTEENLRNKIASGLLDYGTVKDRSSLFTKETVISQNQSRTRDAAEQIGGKASAENFNNLILSEEQLRQNEATLREGRGKVWLTKNLQIDVDDSDQTSPWAERSPIIFTHDSAVKGNIFVNGNTFLVLMAMQSRRATRNSLGSIFGKAELTDIGASRENEKVAAELGVTIEEFIRGVNDENHPRHAEFSGKVSYGLQQYIRLLISDSDYRTEIENRTGVKLSESDLRTLEDLANYTDSTGDGGISVTQFNTARLKEANLVRAGAISSYRKFESTVRHEYLHKLLIEKIGYYVLRNNDFQRNLLGRLNESQSWQRLKEKLSTNGNAYSDIFKNSDDVENLSFAVHEMLAHGSDIKSLMSGFGISEGTPEFDDFLNVYYTIMAAINETSPGAASQFATFSDPAISAAINRLYEANRLEYYSDGPEGSERIVQRGGNTGDKISDTVQQSGVNSSDRDPVIWKGSGPKSVTVTGQSRIERDGIGLDILSISISSEDVEVEEGFTAQSRRLNLVDIHADEEASAIIRNQTFDKFVAWARENGYDGYFDSDPELSDLDRNRAAVFSSVQDDEMPSERRGLFSLEIEARDTKNFLTKEQYDTSKKNHEAKNGPVHITSTLVIDASAAGGMRLGSPPKFIIDPGDPDFILLNGLMNVILTDIIEGQSSMSNPVRLMRIAGALGSEMNNKKAYGMMLAWGMTQAITLRNQVYTDYEYIFPEVVKLIEHLTGKSMSEVMVDLSGHTQDSLIELNDKENFPIMMPIYRPDKPYSKSRGTMFHESTHRIIDEHVGRSFEQTLREAGIDIFQDPDVKDWWENGLEGSLYARLKRMSDQDYAKSVMLHEIMAFAGSGLESLRAIGVKPTTKSVKTFVRAYVAILKAVAATQGYSTATAIARYAEPNFVALINQIYEDQANQLPAIGLARQPVTVSGGRGLYSRDIGTSFTESEVTRVGRGIKTFSPTTYLVNGVPFDEAGIPARLRFAVRDAVRSDNPKEVLDTYRASEENTLREIEGKIDGVRSRKGPDSVVDDKYATFYYDSELYSGHVRADKGTGAITIRAPRGPFFGDLDGMQVESVEEGLTLLRNAMIAQLEVERAEQQAVVDWFKSNPEITGYYAPGEDLGRELSPEARAEITYAKAVAARRFLKSMDIPYKPNADSFNRLNPLAGLSMADLGDMTRRGKVLNTIFEKYNEPGVTYAALKYGGQFGDINPLLAVEVARIMVDTMNSRRNDPEFKGKDMLSPEVFQQWAAPLIEMGLATNSIQRDPKSFIEYIRNMKREGVEIPGYMTAQFLAKNMMDLEGRFPLIPSAVLRHLGNLALSTSDAEFDALMNYESLKEMGYHIGDPGLMNDAVISSIIRNQAQILPVSRQYAKAVEHSNRLRDSIAPSRRGLMSQDVGDAVPIYTFAKSAFGVDVTDALLEINDIVRAEPNADFILLLTDGRVISGKANVLEYLESSLPATGGRIITITGEDTETEYTRVTPDEVYAKAEPGKYKTAPERLFRTRPGLMSQDLVPIGRDFTKEELAMLTEYNSTYTPHKEARVDKPRVAERIVLVNGKDFESVEAPQTVKDKLKQVQKFDNPPESSQALIDGFEQDIKKWTSEQREAVQEGNTQLAEGYQKMIDGAKEAIEWLKVNSLSMQQIEIEENDQRIYRQPAIKEGPVYWPNGKFLGIGSTRIYNYDTESYNVATARRVKNPESEKARIDRQRELSKMTREEIMQKYPEYFRLFHPEYFRSLGHSIWALMVGYADMETRYRLLSPKFFEPKSSGFYDMAPSQEAVDYAINNIEEFHDVAMAFAGATFDEAAGGFVTPWTDLSPEASRAIRDSFKGQAFVGAARNPDRKLDTRIQGLLNEAKDASKKGGGLMSRDTEVDQADVSVIDGFYDNAEAFIKGFNPKNMAPHNKNLPKKAPGSQWLAILSNAPGITKDNIEWNGLVAFLTENANRSLTKDDIIDFLRTSRVTTETRVRIRRMSDDEPDKIMYPQPRYSLIGKIKTMLELLIKTPGRLKGLTGSASMRFTEQDLPKDHHLRYLADSDRWAVMFVHPETGYEYPLATGVSKKRALSTFFRSLAKISNQAYTDSHWYGEENVNSHVRMAVYEDASGNGVALINEIQSDIHEAEVHEGVIPAFSKQEIINAIAESNNRISELLRSNARFMNDGMRFHKDLMMQVAALRARLASKANMDAWVQAGGTDVKGILTEKFGENVNISSPEVLRFILENGLLTRTGELEKLILASPEMEVAINDYVGLASFYTQLRIERELVSKAKIKADEIDYTVGETEGPVPETPFSQNWMAVALKRAVAEFVKLGHDTIHWTTGDAQLLRYESEFKQHIDSLEYEIEEQVVDPVAQAEYKAAADAFYGWSGPGPAEMSNPAYAKAYQDWSDADDRLRKIRKKQLPMSDQGRIIKQFIVTGVKNGVKTQEMVFDENGRTEMPGPTGMRSVSMSSMIGKAMADKIMSSSTTSGTLTGPDLTLGGSLYYHIYDQMLPRLFEKIYGVKPTKTTVDLSGTAKDYNILVESEAQMDEPGSFKDLMEKVGDLVDGVDPTKGAELELELLDGSKIKGRRKVFKYLDDLYQRMADAEMDMLDRFLNEDDDISINKSTLRIKASEVPKSLTTIEGTGGTKSDSVHEVWSAKLTPETVQKVKKGQSLYSKDSLSDAILERMEGRKQSTRKAPNKHNISYKSVSDITIPDIRQSLRKGFATISASRTEESDDVNAANNKQMAIELRRMGFTVIPAEGVYKGSKEESFFVTADKLTSHMIAGLSALARKYNQESIMVGINGKYYFINMYTGKQSRVSGMRINETSLDEDGTNVILPNGTSLHFSIDISTLNEENDIDRSTKLDEAADVALMERNTLMGNTESIQEITHRLGEEGMVSPEGIPYVRMSERVDGMITNKPNAIDGLGRIVGHAESEIVDGKIRDYWVPSEFIDADQTEKNPWFDPNEPNKKIYFPEKRLTLGYGQTKYVINGELIGFTEGYEKYPLKGRDLRDAYEIHYKPQFDEKSGTYKIKIRGVIYSLTLDDLINQGFKLPESAKHRVWKNKYKSEAQRAPERVSVMTTEGNLSVMQSAAMFQRIYDKYNPGIVALRPERPRPPSPKIKGDTARYQREMAEYRDRMSVIHLEAILNMVEKFESSSGNVMNADFYMDDAQAWMEKMGKDFPTMRREIGQLVARLQLAIYSANTNLTLSVRYATEAYFALIHYYESGELLPETRVDISTGEFSDKKFGTQSLANTKFSMLLQGFVPVKDSSKNRQSNSYKGTKELQGKDLKIRTEAGTDFYRDPYLEQLIDDYGELEGVMRFLLDSQINDSSLTFAQSVFGQKIGSFVSNMLGAANDVTIDKWMIRHFAMVEGNLFNIDPETGKIIYTEGGELDYATYEYYEGIIKEAALRYSQMSGRQVTPAYIQSVIWSSMHESFNVTAAKIKRTPSLAKSYDAVREKIYPEIKEGIEEQPTNSYLDAEAKSSGKIGEYINDVNSRNRIRTPAQKKSMGLASRDADALQAQQDLLAASDQDLANMDEEAWIRVAERLVTHNKLAESEIKTIRLLAQRGDMADMRTYILSLSRQSVVELVVNVGRVALLLGYRTVTKNLAGNAIRQVMDEISRIPASVIDIILMQMNKAIGGTNMDRSTTSLLTNPMDTLKAWSAALTKGVTEGGKEFIEILRGKDMNVVFEHPSLFRERTTGIRLFKPLEWFERVGWRFQGAMDRPFNASAFYRTLHELQTMRMKEEHKKGNIISFEEAEGFLTQGDYELAEMYALMATYQKKNVISDKYYGVIDGLPPIFRAIISNITKFVKTPLNVVDYVLDYTGIWQIAKLVHREYGTEDWISWKNSIKRVMDNPQDRKIIAMAISQGAIGTAIMYIGYSMGLAGLIMPFFDREEKKEGEQMEAKGTSWGEVTIAGKSVDISWLSPVAFLLISGATMAKVDETYERKLEELTDKYNQAVEEGDPGAIEKAKQELEKHKNTSPANENISRLFKNLALQTPFLRQIDEIKTAYDQNNLLPGLADKWFSPEVYVPAFVKEIARTKDQYERVVAKESTAERLTEKVQSSIPSLPGLRDLGKMLEETDIPGVRNVGKIMQGREALPVRYDMFGRPVKIGAGWDASATTPLNLDKLTTEMDRLNVSISKPVGATAAEENRLRKQKGELYAPKLNDVINSPEYSRADDKTKKRILENVIRTIGDEERNQKLTPDEEKHNLRIVTDREFYRSQLKSNPGQFAKAGTITDKDTLRSFAAGRLEPTVSLNMVLDDIRKNKNLDQWLNAKFNYEFLSSERLPLSLAQANYNEFLADPQAYIIRLWARDKQYDQSQKTNLERRQELFRQGMSKEEVEKQLRKESNKRGVETRRRLSNLKQITVTK